MRKSDKMSFFSLSVESGLVLTLRKTSLEFAGEKKNKAAPETNSCREGKLKCKNIPISMEFFKPALQ